MKIRPTGKELGPAIGKAQAEQSEDQTAKEATQAASRTRLGEDVIDIARGRAISEALDPSKIEEDYRAKVERIKEAYNAGRYSADSNKVAAAFSEEISLTILTEQALAGDE